jgi:hypothetical protein
MGKSAVHDHVRPLPMLRVCEVALVQELRTEMGSFAVHDHAQGDRFELPTINGDALSTMCLKNVPTLCLTLRLSVHCTAEAGPNCLQTNR